MDGSLIVLVILGAAMGGALAQLPGAFVGGVLAWLIVTVGRLSERVRKLEQARELGDWQAEVRAEQRSEPAVTPSPPVEAPLPQAAEPEVAPVRPQEERPRPAPPAVAARAPAGGGWLADLFASGRAPVWAGITVLFIGVAFLLKYAADSGWLSVEVRLAAAVAGGLALLATGWRLRRRRTDYALVLQGGGLGTLYLTVFVALRLYALVGEGGAFLLMALVAVASAVLALAQNARSLMVASAAGGFLAPLLASTGAGSHVALFGWYALLDVGILAVAWFRAWRELNLLGFAFTFVIGTAWGVLYYQPVHFATVEPFLILFFLLFTAVSVLYALRRAIDPRHYLDGTLVFGTPLVAFTHQAWLVSDYEYGLAWSAAVLALLYGALALLLRRRREITLLREAYGALAVVFASVTLPLAVDAGWTVAGWAVEGAALVWVGCRQERVAPRLFGLLLQLGAGLLFMAEVADGPVQVALLNGVFLGALLVTLSGLFAAYQLHRHGDRLRPWEEPAAGLLLVWGSLWWLWTGVHEIQRFVPHALRLNVEALFAAASALLFTGAQRRLAWAQLRPVVVGLLALVPLLALLQYLNGGQSGPLMHWGFITWPLALAALYATLFLQEEGVAPRLRRVLHGGALALVGFLLAWELAGWLDRLPGVGPPWAVLAWGLVPAALLVVAAGYPGAGWPLGRLRDDYRSWVSLPVAVAGWGWGIEVNLTSAGEVLPLAFLPVLNPLDLIQALLLVALAWWLRRAHGAGLPRTPWPARALAAALLVWVTGMVARAVHHYEAVPFTLRALYRSLTFQASLSVAWGALALTAMVLATRRGWRQLWFAGAALMGVVVAKLFLVDLAGSGTLARIFSFIGAGLLLLLVGYFSPMPPREAGAAADEGQPDEAADEHGQADQALAGEAHAAHEHDENADGDGQQR